MSTLSVVLNSFGSTSTLTTSDSEDSLIHSSFLFLEKFQTFFPSIVSETISISSNS